MKASLVAQMVKHPPAVQEIRIQPLRWENPLKKDMATHPSILCLENPMDRGAWWAIVHGVKKSRNFLWVNRTDLRVFLLLKYLKLSVELSSDRVLAPLFCCDHLE